MKTFFAPKGKDLFESNRFLVLFSLLCAVVLWVYISVNNVKDVEKSFDIPVTITIKDSAIEKMGLGIVDQSDLQVRVTIRGDKFTISKVTTANLKAIVKTSAITEAGTKLLPVAVEPDGDITNFEIVDISTQFISVRVERITDKTFEVGAEFVGLKISDGMWKESHQIEHQEIILNGPESDINKVEKVVARSNVNKTLSETTSVDAEIILLDSSNKEVASPLIKKSADNTKIVINILKKKTINIKVGFLATPSAYTSTAIKHTLSHKTLEIAGPAETIDGLTELEIGKIDFSKIDLTSNNFSFDLKLPSGVVSIDSIAKIDVSIDTSGFAVKYITVTNFQLNKSAGTIKDALILTTSIPNIKIIGLKSEVNKLSSKDFTAYIDVTGQETLTGESQAPVFITAAKYPSCWAVGSYQASVRISE